jgi:lipopolysaccharide transport system ATP-binding protein
VSGQSDDTIVVRANGLSKVFTIYSKPSDILARLFSRRVELREFWALRNISFELRRGEVLGLVGRNGAGKSTLLKILAGTLTPSGGTVEISGRVSAILELGSGFHPDFSGRENIYLGGLCLGMTRAEIDSRIDEIIDFSELREVIDQPFKTYSTGMQARLTFSTVTSVDPELLIVDEALSVGDARFQLKSFGRFEEFRRQGKSIILVSHNMNTITGFCNRAILLEQGQVRLASSPIAVSTFYHRLLFGEDSGAALVSGKATAADDTGKNFASGEVHQQEEPDFRGEVITEHPGGCEVPAAEEIDSTEIPENVTDSREYRFGTKAAEIYDFGILDAQGQRSTLLVSGEKYCCFMRIVARHPVANSCAGFVVRSVKGVDLFGTDTTCIEGFPDLPLTRTGDIVELAIDIRAWLGPGEYFMTFALADRSGLKLDCRFDALHFTVIGPPTIHTTSVVNLSPSFHMRSLPRRAAATASPHDVLVADRSTAKA